MSAEIVLGACYLAIGAVVACVVEHAAEDGDPLPQADYRLVAIELFAWPLLLVLFLVMGESDP